MNHLSRRSLITGAAAVATAARPILGANDRINVAVIGVGGRGRNHVQSFPTIANVRVAGVCDVYQPNLERAIAQATKVQNGVAPKGFSDMHKVFADKEIDCVSVATPNHWHALTAIWAVQAGKDVYLEKPASHNVWEGRQTVAAARKYNRIVQIGSQGRSMPFKIEAMRLLNEGIIGKVYMAKGLCFKRRKSIGKKPDGPVPAGVDWDQFLGPAPMRPFNENRFLYTWHWFWDTGNGDIGNQGIHEMDIARWGLGVGLPKSVVSTGGKFVYDDDQETANTQIATFDYGDKQLVFEVRGLITGPEADLQIRGGNTIGDLFYGEDGWMSIDNSGYSVYKGEKQEKVASGKNTGRDTEVHMQNFINAVRSRKHTDLNADIEVGATSAALVHLANISYRLGRKLNFDPQAQKFIGDDKANSMLTRPYRAPYVVPEKV